ncbi:MAG: type II secretion system protein [Planctomycetota bacterium]
MKRTGFTLVEILIVVIILGILAAIVVPQFTDASNEARMSSIQSDLQTVRSQVELYKAQHNDRDPWTDSVTQSTDFWTQLTTKTNADGTADGNLGPYLQQAPTNPFRDSDAVIDVDDDGTSGWHWDGTKFSALGEADLNGDGDTTDPGEDLTQL